MAPLILLFVPTPRELPSLERPAGEDAALCQNHFASADESGHRCAWAVAENPDGTLHVRRMAK
jgi:hypothetical protein